MNTPLLAILFVVGTWWLSTGLILLLDGLPKSTFRTSVSVVSALAIVGVAGLVWSSAQETTLGAYVAYVSALAIWGWHELVFLLGWVTGPRKKPCPPHAKGWRRFLYATAVVIHHEVALAATVAVVTVLTWNSANLVGVGTLVVLWVMRLSAKLNIYLGVRNLNVQFVPDHLRYMVSYFRTAKMNVLMPFSLVAGSLVAVLLMRQANSTDASTFEMVGNSLVATLLGLAVLEHVFLSIPVPDAALWRWAARGKAR